jgi:hypothetical protein
MDSQDNLSSNDTQMPARFEELTKLVAAMGPDFVKFYSSGNKAAGTRIRVAMQELKVFAQTVRTEVQAMKGGKDTGAPTAEA